MSPDYFLHRLTIAEAQDYMAGQDRRHRQQWEQTRFLSSIVYKTLTGQDLDLTFPWEEEAEIGDEEEQAEAIARLRALAAESIKKQNANATD